MTEDLEKWVALYQEAVAWVETELGVPRGFIMSLSKEDDWSFVIKTHALVEAAVSNQLTASTDPRLSSVFEQLELSDQRKGKVAFAKALDLLTTEQRKYVRFMSELRNKLVHNVRNITFDLVKHYATLDPNQKAAFIDSITYFATNRDGWKEHAIKNPKDTINAATLVFLIQTTTRASSEKANREFVAKKAQLLDDFFGKLPP